MKKMLFVLLAYVCLFSTQLGAQPTVVEGVSARSFSGVQGNGQFFYTFYFGEKTEEKGMANFVLQLFDKDLKSIATKNIVVTKYSELAASAFTGKYFLFIFNDAMKKTRTTITLDKDGNTVKQKVDEDVKRAVLSDESFPSVFAANDDEFIIVRPEKEDKFGFEVERLDKDLNSKWTKSYFPEKGRWDLVDSRFKNGKLYILRSDKPSTLTGDKFYYKVQCINADKGEDVYLTALENEGDGGFPGFISIADDGMLATGGMYFANSKYDDKNSDGFFFALIAQDGKTSIFNKTTWKEVKNQVKGDFSSDLVGGKTKTLIQDLIRKSDGTYVMIGETFRKSSTETTGGGLMRGGGIGKGLMSGGVTKDNSGKSEVGFTVMDFVMLNFDAKGALTGIDKVEKPTREAIIKGEMAEEHGLAIAEWLNDTKKFFCYRYTIDVNGKQFIVFKNKDGLKTKAYFLPVGAKSVDGIGSIDLDRWVSEGLNKVGRFSKFAGGNKTTFESTKTMGQPDSYEIYKNIIPAKPGSMLLYELTGEKMNIWLEPVPGM